MLRTVAIAAVFGFFLFKALASYLSTPAASVIAAIPAGVVWVLDTYKKVLEVQKLRREAAKDKSGLNLVQLYCERDIAGFNKIDGQEKVRPRFGD